MAMFIRVDVNNDIVAKGDGLAKKIIEVCPVNIFEPGKKDGTLAIVEKNVDECVLCDLCTQASPEGVKVVKLY
jgi:NAD-dependent dihydropyrimidine dehydrogenase PreA subunit